MGLNLTLELNKQELAWAAGFFDGEGCTRAGRWYTVTGLERTTPTISIGQALSEGEAIPEVLLRFKAAVGNIGRIRGPHRRTRLGKLCKSQCTYGTAGFQNVQAVIAMLWPWLSPVKRAQAKETLLKRINQPKIEHIGTYTSGNCVRNHGWLNIYTDKAGRARCLDCREENKTIIAKNKKLEQENKLAEAKRRYEQATQENR